MDDDVYAGPVFIAGLGMAVLTGLTFGPKPGSQQIAVVTPPWVWDGPGRVVATGLPILDLHWRGHVIIVQTGGDPAAMDRLRDQGLWLLDATGSGLCGSTDKGS